MIDMALLRKESIGKILNMSDVKLDPNFEENYQKLLKKEDQSWQTSFGRSTLEYFRYVSICTFMTYFLKVISSDGLKYNLEREGFANDDMLQEGFAEGVSSKTVQLRIVTALKDSGCVETVIEGGVVYIQVCFRLECLGPN